MFGKFFKKKEEQQDVIVYAPINGEAVSLKDVPDPVFSEKMMGEGIAIKPADGLVAAPIDGKVIQLFPTKHAVGLQAANGAEILIHIGLETVSMDGEGFTTHVQEGDKVKLGEPLISFDLDLVNEKASSTITPIIITNTDDMGDIQVRGQNNLSAGQDDILQVKK